MGISWTDEQKSVINSRHGNLLVSAAAGSGKTAVLVERILEMVMGVDADGNKAEEKIDIDEVHYDDRQFLPWNRKRLFSDDRDRFLF